MQSFVLPFCGDGGLYKSSFRVFDFSLFSLFSGYIFIYES